MRRLLFKHFREGDKGFAFGLRIGSWTYAGYFGYGFPVWWIPRVIGRGKARLGFGFGWLLFCIRFQVCTGIR